MFGRTMNLGITKSLAGIEYTGQSGISQECINAVRRLIQYGDRIGQARIISCSARHCLLLTVNADDLIAVKSGFSSGYAGEGPHTFSRVLQLLDAYGAEIEEYDVNDDVLERLDLSALTTRDLENLAKARPIRPSRWRIYMLEGGRGRKESPGLWHGFPLTIPFALMDARIADLAIGFFERPSENLLSGFRRLEDIVRTRIGSPEHGVKLFSQAFIGDKSILRWEGLTGSEQLGRGSLFTAAYMAFRNPRAHRELKDCDDILLGEFLILNQLYGLERECKRR